MACGMTLDFKCSFVADKSAKCGEQRRIFRSRRDDGNTRRFCCKLFAQANMLACKFHTFTDFKANCTHLCAARLWCSYREAEIKKRLHLMTHQESWSSSPRSRMFVASNAPTFHAVSRNFMFRFMCRLIQKCNHNGLNPLTPKPQRGLVDLFCCFGCKSVEKMCYE